MPRNEFKSGVLGVAGVMRLGKRMSASPCTYGNEDSFEQLKPTVRSYGEGIPMKHILLLTLAAVSLMAADATGTWTGTFTPDGQEPGPAHLVLKQEGTKVTGTVGPNADEQHEIQNGKAEGGRVTFEVEGPNARMKFELKQEGEAIKGDISREHDGEIQTAKVAVTRNK
jgi:hypothetical protein